MSVDLRPLPRGRPFSRPTPSLPPIDGDAGVKSIGGGSSVEEEARGGGGAIAYAPGGVKVDISPLEAAAMAIGLTRDVFGPLRPGVPADLAVSSPS